MPFRIRDLLITQCAPEEHRTCLPKTHLHLDWHCQKDTGHGPLVPTLPDPTPKQLAQLKARLKQEVRAIEKMQKTAGKPLHPATHAEATRLERQLESALIEVRKIKANLRKKKK